MVIRGMREVPDDDIREDVFQTQVCKYPGISEDMAHYKRLEEGHKERKFLYLCESVNRYIKRTRREKVRAALSRGLLGLGAPPPAAPSTTEEKGKVKEKKRKER